MEFNNQNNNRIRRGWVQGYRSFYDIKKDHIKKALYDLVESIDNEESKQLIDRKLANLKRVTISSYEKSHEKNKGYGEFILFSFAKTANIFLSDPIRYAKLKYLPININSYFIQNNEMNIAEDIYEYFVRPIQEDFVAVTFDENQSIEEWKNILVRLERVMLDILFPLLKENANQEDYYRIFVDQIMIDLAKAFLLKPLDHVRAKFAAISISEQILYKDGYRLSDEVLAELYHHLANFHSHSEYESWRSTIYLNALKKLKDSHSDEGFYQNLYARAQKSTEPPSVGLHRFTGQLVRSSLDKQSELSVVSENDDIPIKKIEGNGLTVNWSGLSLYSILTGANGSRKTVLLNALYKYLREKRVEQTESELQEKFYALHIESEVTGDRLIHGEKTYDFTYKYILKELEFLFNFNDRTNKRVDIFKAANNNFNSRVATAIFDRILANEVSHEDARSFSYITKTAEALVFSENLLSEPVTLVENLFKQYLNFFIDKYLFSEDEDIRNEALNFLIQKTHDNNINPAIFKLDFRETLEEIFLDSWTKERADRYDEIIKNAEVEERLNLIASFINSNCEKYHLWCEEYLDLKGEVSPQREIERIMISLPRYKINFGWRLSNSRGYYLRFDNPTQGNLDKNNIYIYKNAENNWVYYHKDLDEEDLLDITLNLEDINNDYREAIDKGEANRIYKAISKRGKITIGKYRLEFIKDNNSISYKSLSSGEIILTKLVLWALMSKGIEYNSDIARNSKVKILLLDEVDRHLDSKLIKSLNGIIQNEFVKNNVQVIMTTHRSDTLSLASKNHYGIPKAKIYTLKYNDVLNLLDVKETHPLLAMFRLSSNQREISNLHVRVLVEAPDDMQFYDAVHKIFLQYCEAIKQSNSEKIYTDGLSIVKSRYWEALLGKNIYHWSNRLLSKRYQPFFSSIAADEKNSGGGTSAIKDVLPREIIMRTRQSDFYKKKESPVEIIDPIVESSFAIMDSDYDNANQEAVAKKKLLDNKVVFLTRHSLENYLFDPWIVFSLLSKEDLDGKFDENSVYYKAIDYVDRLRNGESIEGLGDPLHDYLSIIIHSIFSHFEVLKHQMTSAVRISQMICGLWGEDLLNTMTSPAEKLKGYIIKNFREIYHIKEEETKKYKKYIEIEKGKVVDKVPTEEGTDINKEDFMINSFKALKGIDYEPSLDEVAEYLINDTEDRKVMYDIFKEPIIFKYPKIFLKLRGHDIEDIILKVLFKDVLFEGMNLKNYLLNKLYTTDYIAFPVDLANILFELNYKIRKQFYPVIKDVELDEKERNSLMTIAVEEEKDFTNSNLRKAEKMEYLKYSDLTALYNLLSGYYRSSEKSNYISDIYESNIPGTITLLGEENHLIDHKVNMLTLIDELKYGDVLCLERKECGENFGMRDVAALANYLKQGRILPEYLRKLPIYFDALLYNRANEKNIPVIGVEEKNLAFSKNSPNYNRLREKNMADNLLKIAITGSDVIFPVGNSHISNIKQLLEEKGFKIVSSEHSSRIKLEHIDTRISESYFADFDFSWQVQKIINMRNIWKYETLKTEYGIKESFDIFKARDSNFKKSVLLKIHPDKNPGKENANQDFAFVNDLRESLNKPFEISKFLTDEVQPIIYKANIGFKFADLVFDSTRFICIPNSENMKSLFINTAHLYSIYSGVNAFSLAINGYNILGNIYQGESYQAAEHAVITAGFMLVPKVVALTASPYVNFVYITGITIFSGYNALNNGYKLCKDLNSDDFMVKSKIAYSNIVEIISFDFWQKLHDEAIAILGVQEEIMG